MAGSAITASPSQLGATTTSRLPAVGGDRRGPRASFDRPCVPRVQSVASSQQSKRTVKIALLQINPTVGDLAGNARLIAAAAREAARPRRRSRGHAGARARRLPAARSPAQRRLRPTAAGNELDDARARARRRAADARRAARAESVRRGAAALQHRGARFAAAASSSASASRCCRPTTSSTRTATSSRSTAPQILELGGWRLGISICEDVWNDRDFWKRRRYHHDPIEELVARRRAGDRQSLGLAVLGRQAPPARGDARQHGAAGTACRSPTSTSSAATTTSSSTAGAARSTPSGAPIARGRAFAADVVDLRSRSRPADRRRPPTSDVESEIWRALVLGTRDYARKCGFTRAVLGLSGGIDSALTAAIAVEALGADHVLGVLMPSPFSSRGSVDDSLALAAQPRHRDADAADRAGACARWTTTLRDAFAGAPRDVTEENIQARIRGNLLMALSNKRGALLLTTGNKSELAVGYCTLYGDMSGGLAVIADVPKTMVYRVARWLNDTSRTPIIPEAILTKAPSAELRPEPDRSGLAAALRRARRHPAAPHRAPRAGRRRSSPPASTPATVHRVLRLVRAAEFKRKQAAPGLKVTDRAFGTGWRMPIAAQIEQRTCNLAIRNLQISAFVNSEF